MSRNLGSDAGPAGVEGRGEGAVEAGASSTSAQPTPLAAASARGGVREGEMRSSTPGSAPRLEGGSGAAEGEVGDWWDIWLGGCVAVARWWCRTRRGAGAAASEPNTAVRTHSRPKPPPFLPPHHTARPAAAPVHCCTVCGPPAPSDSAARPDSPLALPSLHRLVRGRPHLLDHLLPLPPLTPPRPPVAAHPALGLMHCARSHRLAHPCEREAGGRPAELPSSRTG